MDAHAPHPFSKFVAILGRGKTKQRNLTFDESRESMGMILRGEALPEQIGAFLMLLRLKEEGPEEIAGFAQATRDLFQLPSDLPEVDLDWSTYAGKRIQLPWFVLSVMALVQSGIKVHMHGTEGHTPGRVYTRGVLEGLGFPIAGSLEEAANHINTHGFGYTPLEVLSPELRRLIELRPIFGLRSPVHSFSRMLNPFDAPCVMQGIFHRGFMDIHAGAAQTMGLQNMAVFRGEGGEIERRPNKPTQVWTTHGDAEPLAETWPALLDDNHAPKDEVMNTADLLSVWKGDMETDYAIRSITGTMAVTLKMMGRAVSQEAAQAQADNIWAGRDRDFLPFKA